MTDARSSLHALASAYGVDTEYHDWQGEHVHVPDSTLRAVLAALDVDAGTPRSCEVALAQVQKQMVAAAPPTYLVLRAGETHAALPRADCVLLEDGTRVDLTRADRPPELPPGYHRLVTTTGTECLLIVAPTAVPLPTRLARGPAWGLAAQLYSVRSAASWGVGDLGDLGALASWAAKEHSADFVLVNPLHAAEVVAPMEPSPYLPTTRRYANPLYLRVEQIAEYATLPSADRAQVDALGDAVRTSTSAENLLDRDASWAAKRQALEAVYRVGRAAERDHAYRGYLDREGTTLRDFASWCALSEVHGSQWPAWPEPLRTPGSSAVRSFASEHVDRVDFYCWLQWQLEEQLTASQDAATAAGMGVGIIHDVAVGVSPTGADAWAWQGELAGSVTVGAPPDAYSQTGQDWNQPPWRPDRMAALAYAPFRELFAHALRHCGGLRVDHVIGLFRLWWIPRGAPATAGTYVHYDHDALIAILMIEAARADAVLIGEDLGNVEPWVRGYLRERGIFGTSILWFEYEGSGAERAPLPPSRWRELCLASVTTHDLPPTTGYLAGDHVRLRDELGLLTRSVEEELAFSRAEQADWLRVLRTQGLLEPDDNDPERVVEALHRLLSGAPSLLRCAALTDAVGDRRTQNQPGTTQRQHPNWRLPLSGPDGVPILLEQVFTDPRAAALAATMNVPAPHRTG
ncbi:MAG: 4-alpha-glucanotransferase [Jatrophihabitans sp.]